MAAVTSAPAARRRPAVRCAAANDDEDLGGPFDVDPAPARKAARRAADAPASARPAAAEAAASAEEGHEAASGSGRPRVKRREKEFAWMDSESDDEGEEGVEEEGEKEDMEEATTEVLDAVQSFGRMMVLSSSLQQKLRSGGMDPTVVAAACRALTRAKFFDCDLLQDLSKVLVQLLQKESLDALQMSDAIQCLQELNAYDRAVFSAVARAFRTKTAALDPGMRSYWLKVFKGFGHSADQDFLQHLEVPPVMVTSPLYRKVRCQFLAAGCALGAACTYSHDLRAPLRLEDAGSEDSWRSRQTVMTQDQRTLGRGSYGDQRPGAAATASNIFLHALPPALTRH